MPKTKKIKTNTNEEFKKDVYVEPAFDKRNSDPTKNYGIHGCNIRFVLRGSNGVVQFLIFTNWHLPHVTEELLEKSKDKESIRLFFSPIPADIGYHSPKPMYKDQTTMGPCIFLDGKDCYYDGSSLSATEVYNVMLKEGSDAVWRELMDCYKHTFLSDENDTY